MIIFLQLEGMQHFLLTQIRLKSAITGKHSSVCIDYGTSEDWLHASFQGYCNSAPNIVEYCKSSLPEKIYPFSAFGVENRFFHYKSVKIALFILP